MADETTSISTDRREMRGKDLKSSHIYNTSVGRPMNIFIKFVHFSHLIIIMSVSCDCIWDVCLCFYIYQDISCDVRRGNLGILGRLTCEQREL